MIASMIARVRALVDALAALPPIPCHLRIPTLGAVFRMGRVWAKVV
jgi:hypothetical protein